MRTRLLAITLMLTLVACGGTGTGANLTLPDGSAALTWGDGPYGLVLVHDDGADSASWEPQSVVFADEGMTVVAVQVTAPGAIVAAIEHLRDAIGLDRVAVLAAESGTEATLVVGREQPELIDQLILISPTSEDVAALGPFPKLFVASEGEAAAAALDRMAERAPGDWNDVYLADGDATGQAIFAGEDGAVTLEVVLERLAERR